jgi:exonuclease SbcC
MRPLALTLTAFGPFAGTQTVDFRRLGDLRLFLINGPIGAGKTTLLDGICYALYGESSGDERKAAHLRSHHAPPDRATEVVLDFALGDRIWRVRRSPQQERPARRGGGVTTQAPEASLFELTGATDPAGEGRLVSANPRDVAVRLRDLLGFSSAEFRQVVMLPQGRFRDMLAADSGEREKILRTLFQTGRYAAIEERLKEAAKAARHAVERAAERERALLVQAEAEGTADLAERRRAVADAVAARHADVLRLDGEEAAARRLLDAATQAAGRFAAHEAARTAWAAVEAGRAGHATDIATLEAARRAAAVAPLATVARDAAQERLRAETAAADAVTARETARTASDRALAALTAEEANGPARDAAARRAAELTALAERVADLAALHAAAAAAESAVLARTNEHALADARSREAEATALTARERLGSVEKAAGHLGAARLGADDAARRRDERHELAQLAVATAALADRNARALLALDARRRGKADAEARLRDAERAWLDGQAAHLAAHLAAGEPCPVCGSAEHPALARPHEDLPERPDLDVLRAAVAEADRALEAARTEQTTAETEQAVAIAGRDRIAAALAEDAALPPAELDRRTASAQEALATAQAAAAALPGARAAAAEADAALEVAVRAERTATLAHGEALRLQAEARARLDDRLSGIPEPLRAPGRVRDALVAAEGEARRLAAALDAARAAASSGREALAAAEEAVHGSAAAKARAVAAADAADAALAQALFANGFADLPALRAAWLPPERLDAVAAAVGAFARQEAAARARLEEAEAAVAGLAPPDVAASTAAHVAARAAVDAARQDLATAEERERQLARLSVALAEVAAARDAAEARWSTVQRLSDVAAGENGFKLSFQRWVLGALLDDVLLSANRRLQVMSRGRYLLRRAEDAEDRRRKAGLDLDVLDSHTDRPRSVRTLSGGEGFLAALSLALGVVDVVQAYAGGIRVDTLFIDEGFGSLDPEALDAALQSLLDLQSTGRLVGVISHVAELKDRIPARLDVVKATGGSRVEVAVP